MGNRRAVLALALAGVAGTLVAAAPAQGALSPPEVFASAERGELLVVSSVLVSRTGADMRGVWLDESIGCDQWRRIRVRITVSFTPPGASQSRIVGKRKTRVIQNCAEGGPNTGVTVGARGLGFACPSGRWRPGRYDMVTRTIHTATGLTSIASVGFKISAAC